MARNAKGSKAILIDDYRRENARKVNIVKFPISSFYIFNIDGTNYCKLGVSQNVERRFRDITNAMPFNTILMFSMEIKSAYEFEERIHHFHKDKFVNNEWFKLTFDEIVEIITDCKIWHVRRRNWKNFLMAGKNQ